MEISFVLKKHLYKSLRFIYMKGSGVFDYIKKEVGKDRYKSAVKIIDRVDQSANIFACY